MTDLETDYVMQIIAENEAVDQWTRTGRPVGGHLCEGLRDFQQRPHHAYRGLEYGPEYACVPIIEADGRISGCDARNDHAIAFCPFCGIRLNG